MSGKKRTGRIWRGICCVPIVLCCLVLAANLYSLAASRIFGRKNPTVFGFSASVVLSGSMSPAFEAGDIILTRKQAAYAVGDIITFAVGDSSVTHRIVALEEEGYRTKGDANNTEDPWVTAPDNVVGKVFFRVPKIGTVLSFFRTPLGILCFLGLLLVLFELPRLADSLRLHRRGNLEKESKNGKSSKKRKA